jgi:hypothetical protein
MLLQLSLLKTRPELIECISVIRLRMRLRHEQKPSPRLIGERAVAVSTFFIRPRHRPRHQQVPGC